VPKFAPVWRCLPEKPCGGGPNASRTLYAACTLIARTPEFIPGFRALRLGSGPKNRVPRGSSKKTRHREVAKPGIAPGSGPGDRGFKSRLRDHSPPETLAKKVRKAHVVSAFSTVPSEVLFDVFGRKRRTRRRPSLLFCGDDRHAKKIAARLIREVGFEPVDAGPLRVARYLEPFSLAVAQPAYEGNEGPEIAYRIERFGKT
jgi:hypothetical protein